MIRVGSVLIFFYSLGRTFTTAEERTPRRKPSHVRPKSCRRTPHLHPTLPSRRGARPTRSRCAIRWPPCSDLNSSSRSLLSLQLHKVKNLPVQSPQTRARLPTRWTPSSGLVNQWRRRPLDTRLHARCPTPREPTLRRSINIKIRLPNCQ